MSKVNEGLIIADVDQTMTHVTRLNKEVEEISMATLEFVGATTDLEYLGKSVETVQVTLNEIGALAIQAKDIAESAAINMTQWINDQQMVTETKINL